MVTGGAGYIGAHACKALRRAGYVPVTFDNLVTGWQDAVKFGPFEQGDLMDRSRLDEVFAKYAPVAVMHFAALSQVGESMSQPGRYWHNNVGGSLNLIEAAVDAACMNFVFSSTCATYGDQDKVGEFHQPETHLIPLMLDAIDGKRDALTIFGTDYDTPDGTCIRDYVHVCDLVDAHVLGLKWLQDGKGSRVFNLGTGTGFSVREVIDQSRAVTNRAVPFNEGARRAGDATKLVSGSTRAVAELGWQPDRSNLNTMIADAWRWHQTGHFDK